MTPWTETLSSLQHTGLTEPSYNPNGFGGTRNAGSQISVNGQRKNGPMTLQIHTRTERGLLYRAFTAPLLRSPFSITPPSRSKFQEAPCLGKLLTGWPMTSPTDAAFNNFRKFYASRTTFSASSTGNPSAQRPQIHQIHLQPCPFLQACQLTLVHGGWGP